MSASSKNADVIACAADTATSPGTKPVACLAQFHLLLYCNSYFCYFFFFTTLTLLLYKKAVLDYPAGRVEAEVFLLFLYLPVQAARYFFANSAFSFENAMKRNNYLLAFGALTMPMLMFHGYWMQNQSYVLRLDEALNGVTIGVLLVELFLGMLEALLVLPTARLDEVSCIIRVAVVIALNVSVLTITLAVGEKMLPQKQPHTT
ncbi:unnamed protein product [Amoebophrya sp. A120]|nr:unnamed protein product [Amoebophrya sp. A120]|eukprot:GSA120T00003470001.1